MRALRSASRAMCFTLSVGLLLSAMGLAAKAQQLDVIPCRDIEQHYTQRIYELMRQANACHKRVNGAGNHQEPWTSSRDGTCAWWGPSVCAEPVRQCSQVRSQYQAAQQECRRQMEAERAHRERDALERSQLKQGNSSTRNSVGSLSSPDRGRTLLGAPLGKFGQEYMKNLGWALVGPETPSERMQKVHQRPSGLAMRMGYQVWESWDVANAALDLAKALSGPKDANKTDRAVLNLATESALRWSSATPDPSRMFSTFSFLLLKSMHAAILDDLKSVSAQIALLGINNQIASAEHDVWYSAEAIRWKEYIEASAVAANTTTVDMATVAIINELRAQAARIAAAKVQAAEAARQAQERAERAAREEREARDEQERQARLAAVRARERELLQLELQMEAEENARRRAEQQRALNSAIGAFIGGLTSVPRSTSTYVPPPRQTYTPPPPRGGSGSNRCPGATIAVDENCRPIR